MAVLPCLNAMDSLFMAQSRVFMIFMFFSTLLIRPCLAADILDPKKFDQTLSTLAIDGLGTNTLQVTLYKYSFSLLLIIYLDIYICSSGRIHTIACP